MVSHVGGALHEAVRLELLRRIDSGQYAVGEALPSMPALVEEFGVSAITVKRALRDLQPAGVLRTVPGLGTFVRERRRFIRDLDFSLTSYDDAIRHGLKPSIQLQSITREKIADPTFEALAPPDSLMMCVRKVVLTDNMPIMFDTTFLPLTLSDEVIDAFADRFVGDVLRDRGTQFVKTRLLIDAAPASEKAQQAFAIPNGYPTLRRLYQLTTIDPAFSVFGVAESPFDRLAVSVELDATNPRSMPEKR
jgi:DNA-binding GntR family transcriptional regulator